MDSTDNIYVAGHTGLVGSAIVRLLKSNGFENIITLQHSTLDLTSQAEVNYLFQRNQVDYVFLCAAKVGGIMANENYPAKFIYENLQIQTNVIHAAYRYGVKKLLFLGSSCIYPGFRVHTNKILESELLTNSLEPTNEAYAIAKIAGIKMCQAYRKQYGFNTISLMPTNIYGPKDNFNLESGHVMAALIRKFHEAKKRNSPEVIILGTGNPKREFLHVNDLAEAMLFLMKYYDDGEIINVGTGKEISILELATLMKKVSGYKGSIINDTSYPDGTFRKTLNIDKITKLGWTPKISLYNGIKSTWEWYDSVGKYKRKE